MVEDEKEFVKSVKRSLQGLKVGGHSFPRFT